jgi:Fe-S cluster assembly iron-binding protein IscA
MLKVSDAAAATLHDTLERNQAGEDEVLRIEESDEGLALAIGKEREGDETYQHQDRTVLALDRSVASALDGATIDVVDTDDGRRLVLQPNEEGA